MDHTDINNLIRNHTRRLQKLKETRALYGLDTPPQIVIEIEDIEEELNRLLSLKAMAPSLTSVSSLSQEDVTLVNNTYRLPFLKNGTIFLNRFSVKGFIGRGGFSDAYVAWDRIQDREVCIKLLKFDSSREFLRLFVEREIKMARLLASDVPGVVATHEVIQFEGGVCFVQDRIPGESLAERIKSKGIISEKESITTIIKLCYAVSNLHKRGIAHCDIKPLNIIITSPSEPILIDLGTARFFGERLERDAVAVSIPFSSLELWTGEPIDGRVDIYSLGVTLLQMVTGEDLSKYSDSLPYWLQEDMSMIVIEPYTEEGQKEIQDYIEGKMTTLAFSPLYRVLQKAIAVNRETRYATIVDFQNDLEKIL